MRNIIGLITDFGLLDSYVGVVKAVLYSIHSEIDIVDLTHNIPPQNIQEAARVLANSYRFFPKKSVFCWLPFLL